nr:hypothetical protein K-LCC10_0133 [Kaumoebavirus]
MGRLLSEDNSVFEDPTFKLLYDAVAEYLEKELPSYEIYPGHCGIWGEDYPSAIIYGVTITRRILKDSYKDLTLEYSYDRLVLYSGKRGDDYLDCTTVDDNIYYSVKSLLEDREDIQMINKLYKMEAAVKKLREIVDFPGDTTEYLSALHLHLYWMPEGPGETQTAEDFKERVSLRQSKHE